VVRLNGSNLQLSSPDSLPLTLAPHATQLLRVNATLGQLAPGPHMLQAYLLDDPLQRLTTQFVVVLQEPALPTSQPTPATQPAATQPTSQPTDPAPDNTPSTPAA